MINSPDQLLTPRGGLENTKPELAKQSVVQLCSSVIKDMPDWQYTLSQRIDKAGEKRGLSEIQKRILNIEAKLKQLEVLSGLKLLLVTDNLTSVFQNDLFSPEPGNLSRVSGAGIFLPGFRLEQELDRLSEQINETFSQEIEDLIIYSLQDHKDGNILLDAAVQSAADILDDGKPEDEKVRLWEITYNLSPISSGGKRGYKLNPASQKVYDKLCSGQEDLPEPWILSAALYYYYGELGKGGLDEEEGRDIEHELECCARAFLQTIREDKFPDGLGNIFQEPASVKEVNRRMTVLKKIFS